MQTLVTSGLPLLVFIPFLSILCLCVFCDEAVAQSVTVTLSFKRFVLFHIRDEIIK